MLSYNRLLAKRNRCLNRLWRKGGCSEYSCFVCHYDTHVHCLWEDTGNATVLVVLIDEWLPKACFLRFYVPYIRKLEETKRRNYLIHQSSDWTQIQAWIVEMTGVTGDSIQEYIVSLGGLDDHRNQSDLAIPYNAESAALRLSIHTENPSITFTRQDGLIRDALRVKQVMYQ
jgi:hypothetical protein